VASGFIEKMTDYDSAVLEAMQKGMEGLQNGDPSEVARSLLSTRPSGIAPFGFYHLVGLAFFKAEKFDLSVRFLLREVSLHTNNLAAVDLLWMILDQCHLSPKREFTYKLISSLLSKESIVVEVGSSYGRSVKYFLDDGFSVVSIEPRKQWCDLQKIVFKNAVSEQRLVIQEFGCSNATGDLPFYLSNDVCNIFSSLNFEWKNYFPGSFLSENTDFVPINKLSETLINLSSSAEAVLLDCEGEELRIASEIFQNTPQDRIPRCLVIFFHPPSSTSEAILETARIGLSRGFSRARFITDWWQVTVDEGKWVNSVSNIDTSMWAGVKAHSKWQVPSPVLILHREDK